MRRAWAGLALLALAGPAAAYTAEEDATYARAYAQCVETRMLMNHRKQAIVPAEVALAHVGGNPGGLNFHAYMGCKDAVMGEPRRPPDVARPAPRDDPRDDWQDRDQAWFPWLPGLGPYTWVLFADLLLGVACGIFAQRVQDRRRGGDRDPRMTTLIGTLHGLAFGFIGFAMPFLATIFFMFLSDPTPPIHLFLVSVAIIVLAAGGGLASLLWPV